MTLPPHYFDAIYDQHDDPWGFRTRWYEQRKQAVTLAALTAPRYRSVFEPGCSIGVLTSALAERTDQLLAMDVSNRALTQAAVGLPPHVRLQQGSIPEDWPNGSFELVVLSEIGYYLDRADCRRLADLAAAAAGELVSVHWRHPVADYPLTGDEVHECLRASAERAGLHEAVVHREPDFRLDVWVRDRRSVAQRAGLVAP